MKKNFLYVSSIIVLMIITYSCKQTTDSAIKKVFKKETTLAPVKGITNQYANLVAKKILKKEKTKQALPFAKRSETKEELDMYDGPEQREEFEFNRIKDPATGKIPMERLIIAKQKTEELKNALITASLRTTALAWTERGPIFDTVGPSNGNSRGVLVGMAPNTYTSGRIRAVLVDASDATGNTVFVGGVDGGLWKCTNFAGTTPPNWQVANDFFSNLAISYIAQDPVTPDIMYFSTGEPTANGDRVLGNGLWKSTDHGVTWNLLPSTTAFTQIFRVVIDNNHNIYLAIRGQGIQRSNDGGTSWTNITPTGIATNVSCTDVELSSTGVLHASFGYYTSGGNAKYRFTKIPATATSADWRSPVGLPDTPTSNFNRIELATKGDTIYAAPTNTSNNVVSTYKSVDTGATWTKNNLIDYASGVSNTQGWYNITLEISPFSSAQFLVGGLDAYLSIDSGKTVTRKTFWVNSFDNSPGTPYVHADHHFTKWMNVAGESRVIIASDGGMFLSKDGGVTFSDRNQNLGIKQFYSVAIHPTTTNYFLAGAQDNGVHQLTKPGLASSVEVTGGDGAFVAIDQDQPQYQFGSYVYNQYRRSTNGGTSWSNVNYSTGAVGMFINPYDYDNNNNKIYASGNANTFLRWENPQTGSTFTPVTIALSGNKVSAVKVSPYTANQIYIGTNGSNSRLLKVSAANTATPVVTDIKDSVMPAGGYVSCINTGINDRNLIMCFSNYGVTNVWVSKNGGTSWDGIDGNLPDMPVRWVIFYPGDSTKAVIATETGVWETDNINGAATVWTVNATFPMVRTDMLKYRSMDGTIAAATHGRGLWTAQFPIPVTTWTGAVSNSWTVAGNWTNGVPNASYNVTIPNVSPNSFPLINNVQAVNNLTINSSANITITSPGSLAIGGNFNSNGVISGTGVVLPSGGSGQSISGNGTVSNLTLNSGATIASGSGNTLSVTGVLNIAGTLYTNNNLVLKSTAIATASIGQITDGSIEGNTIVERYISNKRAWRLMGIPFASSSQTIKAAWQEGATLSAQNPNPPYGTHITTFVGDVRAANYDAVKPGSSIRIYTNDNFNSDSTHTPNTSNNIVANHAYFLFVRGDRSTDRTVSTVSSEATLRINGMVNTGNVTRGALGTSFSLIPNPYPSPIDFDAIKAITANAAINKFYVWDATLGAVGQYRTIDISGTAPNYTYTATPSSGASNNWRFIESGTAFMIPGSMAVEFTEATKSSGTPPSSMMRTVAGTETELSINLNKVNADNTTSLTDGVRLVFDNAYAKDFDKDDAKKITGFNDNFGIVNGNEVLAIDKRPLPKQEDIINLSLLNTTPGNYQFEIHPDNFSATFMFVYLKDNYLNNYTLLSLTADTKIGFTINSDGASSAANRFSIVFTKSAISPGKPMIVIYPNPVQNGLIKLQMNNMPKGIYGVRLLNSVGQTILTRQINHSEGSSTETINVNTIKGSYMLEVVKPDNSKFTNKIIIN